MAGNSQRKGALRKPGTKKGMQVGSGGQRSRALEGKKSTPKATERPHHPAARRAAAAARRDGPSRRPSTGSAGGGNRSGGNRGASKAGKESQELVAGRNSVVEALRAGIPGGVLYLAERIDTDERVREALKLCAEAGVPLLEAPRAELDRMTNRAFHQGLVLQVPPYEYAHADDLLVAATRTRRPALIVALDGVTDPRNLGAVIRSAEAFGGHGVLVPERRAAGVTAGAWKASAGAVARLPVARATNLTRALVAYQKAGLMVVALAGDGDTDIGDLELATGPICLVIGAEGKGVSRLVSETADLSVRIPMSGGTESLNAGVAAGIALYEIARRRTRP